MDSGSKVSLYGDQMPCSAEDVPVTQTLSAPDAPTVTPGDSVDGDTPAISLKGETSMLSLKGEKNIN